MRVILFERRFWEAVVTGEKVHTIRRPRKRQIDPGNRLSLRGWEGKPYRSSQRVLLEETCIAVREIWIGDHIVVGDEQFWDEDADAFARTDGFPEGFMVMQEFLRHHHGLPVSGELIQWGVHPLLRGLGELRGWVMTERQSTNRTKGE